MCPDSAALLLASVIANGVGRQAGCARFLFLSEIAELGQSHSGGFRRNVISLADALFEITRPRRIARKFINSPSAEICCNCLVKPCSGHQQCARYIIGLPLKPVKAALECQH